MNSRIAAHILCPPYCVVFIYTVALFGWFKVCDWTHSDEPPGIFIVPPFLAYYFVPSVAGICYFLLSQGAIVLGWLKSPPEWRYRRWLIAYNVILFFYFGYIIWWYATGPHTGSLGYL